MWRSLVGSAERRHRSSPRFYRFHIEPLETRAMLSITVTSTGDQGAADPSLSADVGDGSVTLRSAIEAANAQGGNVEIDFDIPGPTYTIYPGVGNPLPPIIAGGVNIAGGTEPGGHEIVLDGTSTGTGANGLTIEAAGCAVSGLTVQHFDAAGIAVVGANTTAMQDEIVLDLPPLGPAQLESDPDDNNSIFGNVIINNTILHSGQQGILISHSSQNTVEDNTIGYSGTAGVEIDGAGGVSILNTLADTDASERIDIHNDATQNSVIDNYIGIDAAGDSIANSGDGILLDGASYNHVGEAGSGNFISDNQGNGIHITGNVTGVDVSGDAMPATAAITSIAALAANPAYQASTSVLASAAEATGGLAEPGTITSDDSSDTTTIEVDSYGDVPTENTIQGNWIGTLPDGTATYDAEHHPLQGNQQDGILIEPAARVTVIGSDDLLSLAEQPVPAGNVIGASGKNGIEIVGDPLNANPIDEAELQETKTFDDHGVPQWSLDNQTAFENNSSIFELVPTIIAGNSIGITSVTTESTSATYLIPNGLAGASVSPGDGVFVHNSRAFVFRNTISANYGNGVEVKGAPTFSLTSALNSWIAANNIGTDAEGEVSLADEQGVEGNLGNGILLDGDSDTGGGVQYTVVGPWSALSPSNPDYYRNVISGNHEWGVHVAGLGVYHTSPDLDQYPTPPIGPDDGELHEIYGTFWNYISDCYIGVDGTGLRAGPNSAGGILVDNAATYTIIGSQAVVPGNGDAAYGNVISGNGPASDAGTDGAPGVEILGQLTTVPYRAAYTEVTVLALNLIGLDKTGATALGNNGPGVILIGDAHGNNIGGDLDIDDGSVPNWIAGNNGPGVVVQNNYDDASVDNYNESLSYAKTDGSPNFPFGLLPSQIPGWWIDAYQNGSVASTNSIVGNYIGIGRGVIDHYDPITDAPVYTPLPVGNLGDGILVENSSNVSIGATTPAAANRISANQGNGIRITGADSFLDFVEQDLVGRYDSATNAAAFANEGDGLLIDGGANHNLVGAAGIGPNEYASILNASDIAPDSAELEILIAVFSEYQSGNVFSGNGTNGIEINGDGLAPPDETNSNQIDGGNYIGTDLTGSLNLGNASNGVLIDGGSESNFIEPGLYVEQLESGEDLYGVSNVITFNGDAGIAIDGNSTSLNVVTGYSPIFPGYAIAPNQINSNGTDGVLIDDGASDNTIGGTGSGAGNVIGLNGASGVAIEGSTIDVTSAQADESGDYLALTLSSISGLFVGETIGLSGVTLTEGSTTTRQSQATITALPTDGSDTITTNVLLDGATASAVSAFITLGVLNDVQGNSIGVDGSGSPLPNTGDGVLVSTSALNTVNGNTIANNAMNGVEINASSTYNTVGGTSAGSPNTITNNGTSATPTSGVLISDPNTDYNVVAGNFVGTNASDATGLGNVGNGITIINAASHNTIGGSTGADNVIADNAGNGVTVAGAAISVVEEGTPYTTGGSEYLTLQLTSIAGLQNGEAIGLSGVFLLDTSSSTAPITVITTATIYQTPSGSTIVTNVLMPTDPDVTLLVVGGQVIYNIPEYNAVEGNFIGTDPSATLQLSNSGDGIQINASSNNTVAANTIEYNALNGIEISSGSENNTVGGTADFAANVVEWNTHNGIAIDTGSEDNTIGGLSSGTGNTIWDNGQGASGATYSGLAINGAKDNFVVGNDIEDNYGDGVSLSNGAEGNGVGVQISGDGAEGGGLGSANGNVIKGNGTGSDGGYGVDITGSDSQYNMISGGNIIAGGTGAAIWIGGSGTDIALNNVVGDGGEGFPIASEGESNDASYLVGYGNLIEAGSDGQGVVTHSSNGAEGDAVIGNSFIGNLDTAIDTSDTTDYPAPGVVVNSAALSGDDVALNFTLSMPSVTSKVRIDVYLLNPTTGDIYYVSIPDVGYQFMDQVYDPSSGDLTVSVDVPVEDISSLDGWSLVATATYDLNGNSLRIGSTTSDTTAIALS